MAHHAKKGGEIGANGEFYKGGQFVADSEHTVKGKKKKIFSGSHKIPVEPGKPWVKVDRSMDSIMRHILVGLWNQPDWRKTGVLLDSKAEEICNRNHWSFECQKELIRRFNAGERLIPHEEFLELAKIGNE